MHAWMNRVAFAARRGSALLVLTMLAACGGEEAAAPATPLPEGVAALGADARLPLPPPQDKACQPPSIRKVFRDTVEWEGYWEFGLPAHCPKPALPAGFDWAREHVVLVSMGRRESPADSITVQGTGVVGDSMLVVVRRTSRQDGCAEPAVDTWPRDMVRVPAAPVPAKFVEQQVKLPCPEA